MLAMECPGTNKQVSFEFPNIISVLSSIKIKFSGIIISGILNMTVHRLVSLYVFNSSWCKYNGILYVFITKSLPNTWSI